MSRAIWAWELASRPDVVVLHVVGLFAILKKKPRQLRYEQRYDPSDKVNHPLHSLRTSQGNISSDTCVVASLPVFDDPAGVLDPYVMHDVAVRANPS